MDQVQIMRQDGSAGTPTGAAAAADVSFAEVPPPPPQIFSGPLVGAIADRSQERLRQRAVNELDPGDAATTRHRYDSMPDAGPDHDDADPVNGIATVTAVNGASAHVGNPLAGDHGRLTLNADGSYSYDIGAAAADLPAGATVTDEFTYTVIDGDGTANEVLTVTITGDEGGVSASTNADPATAGGPGQSDDDILLLTEVVGRAPLWFTLRRACKASINRLIG